MEKEVTIYGLECPIENVIKYVGRTTNLTVRVNAHMAEETNRAKCKWLRSLVDKGLKPKVIVLDRTSQADARTLEHKHLMKYRGTALNMKTDIGAVKKIQKGCLMHVDLAAKLTQMAKETKCSEGYIINQALTNYLKTKKK